MFSQLRPCTRHCPCSQWKHVSDAKFQGSSFPDLHTLCTTTMHLTRTLVSTLWVFLSLVSVMASRSSARFRLAGPVDLEIPSMPCSKTRRSDAIPSRGDTFTAGKAAHWSICVEYMPMPTKLDNGEEGFIGKEIVRIREICGPKGRVIGAVSGGVDSTVAAKLMHEAIGDRFHAIMVDNGVLRLNEAQQVNDMLNKDLGVNLTVVDASELFLSQLHGVEDPEQKRKIIGNTFINVFFETEASKIEEAPEKEDNGAEAKGKIEWLLQGTLYPDVIESISFKGPSATIKTHHNVGGLLKDMKLKLIEPLRELFKDEVRALGRLLSIPAPLGQRHPFPGPGLAIRILGPVTREQVKILQQADHIYIEEIRKANLYNQISQAMAILLPVKAVGVMGDKRTYEQVIALRAVTSEDFMTADWYAFPPEVLRRTSSNEVSGINRVTYDISSKPPALSAASSASKDFMSSRPQTAVADNAKILPVFATRLASKDVNEYINTANKLKNWLGSEKAYYPDALRNIVLLFEIAHQTFTTRFLHIELSAVAAMDIYQALIRAVIPFLPLFTEEDLQYTCLFSPIRLHDLIQSSSRVSARITYPVRAEGEATAQEYKYAGIVMVQPASDPSNDQVELCSSRYQAIIQAFDDFIESYIYI
ncbi:hypothetical protein BDR07DRAFT_1466347 [Suillus spraguei]|nr:hypothetical protein BDR07DRAFT_1466347 [Suillus spraguei]